MKIKLLIVLVGILGLLFSACEVVEVGKMPGAEEKPDKPAKTSDQKTSRKVTTASDCIKYENMVLMGVKLKDSEERVIRNLGKPFKSRSRVEKGEDGNYPNNTLYYNNLEVEIVWGEVTRILTRSERAALPGGVRVGMEYEEVMNVLSKKMLEKSGEAKLVSFTNCDENLLTHTSYLILEFNLRNQLTSIEITTTRP